MWCPSKVWRETLGTECSLSPGLHFLATWPGMCGCGTVFKQAVATAGLGGLKQWFSNMPCTQTPWDQEKCRCRFSEAEVRTWEQAFPTSVPPSCCPPDRPWVARASNRRWKRKFVSFLKSFFLLQASPKQTYFLNNPPPHPKYLKPRSYLKSLTCVSEYQEGCCFLPT